MIVISYYCISIRTWCFISFLVFNYLFRLFISKLDTPFNKLLAAPATNSRRVDECKQNHRGLHLEIFDGKVKADESHFSGHRKHKRGRGAAGIWAFKA